MYCKGLYWGWHQVPVNIRGVQQFGKPWMGNCWSPTCQDSAPWLWGGLGLHLIIYAFVSWLYPGLRRSVVYRPDRRTSATSPGVAWTRALCQIPAGCPRGTILMRWDFVGRTYVNILSTLRLKCRQWRQFQEISIYFLKLSTSVSVSTLAKHVSIINHVSILSKMIKSQRYDFLTRSGPSGLSVHPHGDAVWPVPRPWYNPHTQGW